MKALVLEAMHQPLQLKEVETPKVASDEILVKIHAAALNHRDVWIQKGQYAGLKYPIILGSDGAGVVAGIGEGVDKSWMGKEVIINPGLNWGESEKTHSKAFKILGLPDDGTFAEYVKVPALYVLPKPAHLSMEQAATLPLAGLTAYRALFTRANLQAGDRVLVTGAGGGVAQFLIQFALAAGAKVFVTSGSDEKIQKAKAVGVSGGANYTHADWVDQLKAQAGNFDVIIDSAAGEGFAKLVELADLGGRIVFFGGTKGVINGLIPARVFWKQLSILGTTMGSEAEFKAMLDFVNNKQLVPGIDKVIPFEEAELAMQYMSEGAQFGKIVLKIV
jgi:NADPH:quinone reductase-like Zn-dependent oxidoreductase